MTANRFLNVRHWKSLTTGIEVFSNSDIFMHTEIAMSEVPPDLKKSSVIPTCSRFRVACHSSHNYCSSPLAGAT
ncbi:hypothetical protein EMIT051CA3_20614 [Pseudomonas chlororaphis]